MVIAVNCTQAASTCFCTSMNTGPRCTSGFDLAFTELQDGFVVEVGSANGQAIVDKLSISVAMEEKRNDADAGRQQAVNQITKRMDTTNIRDLLMSNLEHARWDDVGSALLVLHELHDGLSNLFLQHSQRSQRSLGRSCRARTAMGFVFQS